MPGGVAAAAEITALAHEFGPLCAGPGGSLSPGAGPSATEGTMCSASRRTFDIRYFCAFCPWHQPELVPLVFRVPGTTLQEVLREVEQGVSSTRLEFAHVAVPTVPQ